MDLHGVSPCSLPKYTFSLYFLISLLLLSIWSNTYVFVMATQPNNQKIILLCSQSFWKPSNKKFKSKACLFAIFLS